MTMLKFSQEPKAPLRARLVLKDQMLRTFQEAAKERGDRSDWVPVPGDPTFQELKWIKFERDVMLEAVNHERSARGLSPINIRNFMMVERLAVGHSDYANKLALYCAQLAVDEITFVGDPAPVVARTRRRSGA